MKPESQIATDVRSLIHSKSELYTQDKADAFMDEDEIQEEKKVDTNPKRKATEADQGRKGEKKLLKRQEKIEAMLSSVKKDILHDEEEVQVDTQPKHKAIEAVQKPSSRRRLRRLKKKRKIEAKLRRIKKNTFMDEDEIQEEKQVDTKPKRKATEADQERKREKRRLKKQQLIEARLRSVQKETAVAKAEAIDYLHQWNSSREFWHFKKKQQYWLLKNAFDTNSISDSDFKIFLEYIVDLKGAARSRLIEESEKIIKLQEEKVEDSDSASINPAFDRARSIVQII